MLRLFSLFGKSAAVNAVDDALRAAGVHPILVPEAVKLTLIRLHRQAGSEGAGAYGPSAELLAFCLLGREGFDECNGAAAAERSETRLEAAVAEGDSFDSRLVLLALHAGLVAPEIADTLDIQQEG